MLCRNHTMIRLDQMSCYINKCLDRINYMPTDHIGYRCLISPSLTIFVQCPSFPQLVSNCSYLNTTSSKTDIIENEKKKIDKERKVQPNIQLYRYIVDYKQYMIAYRYTYTDNICIYISTYKALHVSQLKKRVLD